MSLLGEILAAKEPLFEHTLKQLEAKTGNQGIDAKLAADIRQSTHRSLLVLGLNQDSSHESVYAALVARVKQDDERLCRIIGGSDPTDLAALTPKIVAAVEAEPMPKSGWFLKPARAKQLLVDMPPKGIMKLLGYQSVAKLIKDQEIAKLFCALRFCETPGWLNRFNDAYSKKLKPADFEARDIQIVIFESDQWEKVAAPYVAKKLHNITHSKEMGAVCVLPVGNVHTPGVTIKILPLITHYFNEIRLYSSFFKLVRHRSNFGQIIGDTLVAKPPKFKVDTHADIEFAVIQRYFGKLPHEKHPEIFKPHLQPEDLHWRKAEDVLYHIDPELDFWRGLDFVAEVKSGQLVSFNLMDLALSFANQLKFADRYIYHCRESLWNEIFARYFGEPKLQKQILEHLDNEVIKV